MSRVEAHRGEIGLVIDFATSDVDTESEYTVSGSMGGAELVDWLNQLTKNACAQDGLSGLYNHNDSPRSIIAALRFAMYNVVLPYEWEHIDDPEPEEEADPDGTEAPPEVM